MNPMKSLQFLNKQVMAQNEVFKVPCSGFIRFYLINKCKLIILNKMSIIHLFILNK